MNPFEVTILGNNSALPAFGRHPTSHFITINHQHILMDCGEGSQMRMREIEHTKAFQINHIFISHLHGDHYFGLLPLLNSYALLGRKNDLHLFAHAGMKQLINLHSQLSGFRFPYQLYFHVVPQIGSGILYENEHFRVNYFQLKHRIPCTGYRFTEKLGKKKVRIEKLEEYNIPRQKWNSIQLGSDFVLQDGSLIPHEELTFPHKKARSYSFCSDTIFSHSFLNDILDSDLLYVESTYLEDRKKMAKERFHCTAKDAAELAKLAHAKKLIVGHFSSRYRHLQDFETQARQIFENTELAIEGNTFQL